MAHAHFGVGDKSKWGYLGSRKAVYEEWKKGKTIAQLASVFDCSEGDTRELIIEYLLYLEATNLSWTKSEKAKLLSPAVRFNPPVRFLQTAGHKDKIGIDYDTVNLKILFKKADSKQQLKHLVKKIVVDKEKGLGATAKYEKVFQDYVAPADKVKKSTPDKEGQNKTEEPEERPAKVKPYILFDYKTVTTDKLIVHLMSEARDLNCKNFPGCGTFLLRNILEAVLKDIIHRNGSNPEKKPLDLEGAMNLCQSNAVKLNKTDKAILKQFKNDHLDHLNLGAHGNVIPNYDRLVSARDGISQFIKGNV